MSPPDEHAVLCQMIKIDIKMKVRDSEDSSHQIVSKSLLTVYECTDDKLSELDSLKRTIQLQPV